MSAIPTSFSTLSPDPTTFYFFSFFDEESLDAVALVSKRCLKCVAAFRINDFQWKHATILTFGAKLAQETKQYHPVWEEVYSALETLCLSLGKQTPMIRAIIAREPPSTPNKPHPKSAKRPSPLKIPDYSDEDKIKHTNPGNMS